MRKTHIRFTEFCYYNGKKTLECYKGNATRNTRGETPFYFNKAQMKDLIREWASTSSIDFYEIKWDRKAQNYKVTEFAGDYSGDVEQEWYFSKKTITNDNGEREIVYSPDFWNYMCEYPFRETHKTDYEPKCIYKRDYDDFAHIEAWLDGSIDCKLEVLLCDKNGDVLDGAYFDNEEIARKDLDEIAFLNLPTNPTDLGEKVKDKIYKSIKRSI